MTVVAIELRGHAIVSEEQIRPAVPVVIEHRDPHRLIGRSVEAGSCRHILEPRSTQITIEFRRRRLVGIRAAVAADPFLSASDFGLGRPLHVVPDEEIGQPVPVVVQPGGADREIAIANARSFRDIEEPSVPFVVKQPSSFRRRHEDVVATVIVVIGDGRAERVPADRVEAASR